MAATVFSHLALRFGIHPENLATEALGFVLGRSDKTVAALSSIAQRFGVRLPEGLRFGTQATGEDGSRPDLVGSVGDQELLLVEAKFWAGLTERQPTAYLKRLPTSGGLLLFVCPAARLSLVWGELRRRCADEGMQLSDSSSPISESFAASVNQVHAMAIISWRSLLNALKSSLTEVSDSAVREDISQLEGLCERMDAEAYLPVTQEELTSQAYRRVLDFGYMLDPIADLLVQRHVAQQPRTSRESGVGHVGRYLTLSEHWVLLLCDVRKWLAYTPTPFWLSIRGSSWNGTAPKASIDALYPLQRETPQRLFFARDGFPVVPLFARAGLERDAMIEEIVAQVADVGKRLPPPKVDADGASQSMPSTLEQDNPSSREQDLFRSLSQVVSTGREHG